MSWRQVGDATAMVMELGMEGGIHRDEIGMVVGETGLESDIVEPPTIL